MSKEIRRFKSFLILLLVVSLVFGFVGVVFGETVTGAIRQNCYSTEGKPA